MKRYFLYLLSLLLVFSQPISYLSAQTKLTLSLAKPHPSEAKNVRNLSGESLGTQDYGAFGSIANCGDHLIQIIRWGTGHLTGGKWYKRIIPLSTLTPGPWSLLYEHTYNLEDVYIHRVGDSLIVMGSASDNNFNGNGWDTRECFFLVCDLNGNLISGPHDIAGGTSGLSQLQRAWPFGRGGSLGVPGAYGQTVVSYDLAPPDYNSISAGKIWFYRTTDSWQTFQRFEMFSSVNVDETLLIPFPDGRAIAILRRAGRSWMFKCPNTLATTPTWTSFGEIELGFYHLNTKVHTYDIYNNLVDIVFADRDQNTIAISRGNTFDNLYNGVFNDETVFAYATVAGSFYTPLGYPAYVDAGPSSLGGRLKCLVYSRETQGAGDGGSVGVAQIWGSFFDPDHDETGPPLAPPALTSFAPALSTTGFRVDISGYTEAQIANIDYWVWDISTSPSFTAGTFITTPIEWAHSAVLVKDQRIPGQSIWPAGLTSGTTYYIRCKAVNNTGSSSYTSTSVITN